ncbi:unnamed protein product, partial [Prorocentrum cordatum]
DGRGAGQAHHGDKCVYLLEWVKCFPETYWAISAGVGTVIRDPASCPGGAPTSAPVVAPTMDPTAAPTGHPTEYPTGAPTPVPTPAVPTAAPTALPTVFPTPAPPTAAPTPAPPTMSPTAPPTLPPSEQGPADDARFLLHATFGPTKETLQELSGKSYPDWVQEQMQLPASSHREYYRKRVSPRKNSDTAHINLAERPICTKGSRWHGYALTRDDIGSSIFISGGKVLIGNVARTDIDAGYANNGLSAPMTCTDVPTPQMVSENEACSAHGACKYDNDWVASKYCQQSCFDAGNGYDGDDCSGGWPSRNGWGGFVCLVQEEVGGMVVLGTQSDCSPWGVRIYLYNPAIWFADASVAVPTTLPFDQASWRPGLIFLREDAQNCNLDSKGLPREGAAAGLRGSLRSRPLPPPSRL